MQIPIPYGVIAIFISLFTFYYFNKKAQIKKQERRDKLNKKRQEFLDTIVKKAKEGNEDMP
jgi:phosphotransferase system  glucose/maltose/N-acetylglucosamine-specific IIC component